jgi:hypothetical protein
MTERGAGPTAAGLRKLAPSWWRDTKVRTVLQLLFLVGMGAVAAFGKAIMPPLGIPGSSSIAWLTPMVLGYVLVRKRGAGVMMGASMALWGVPMGIHNTLIYNLGLYGGTGLALDITAALPRISIRSLFGALFFGVFAHMVKFGFVVNGALTSGVAKNFLVLGLAKSALLHVAFGAGAGLMGWLIYKACQTRRRNSQGEAEESV